MASGVLELFGVGVAVYAFARVIRRGVQPPPRGASALLPATMGGSLIIALVLNVFACLELARGALVVSFALDEALLHLELWGFASSTVQAAGFTLFARAGQTATGEFTFDTPGTFDLICSIPGHKDAGMKGTLSVVDPRAASSTAATGATLDWPA